jgi:hypothetical protein
MSTKKRIVSTANFASIPNDVESKMMQYLDVISHHNFCLTEKRHEKELPILKCGYFRGKVQKLVPQVEDIRSRISTVLPEQSLQQIVVVHNNHLMIFLKQIRHFTHAFALSIKDKHVAYIKARLELFKVHYEFLNFAFTTIQDISNMFPGVNFANAFAAQIEMNQNELAKVEEHVAFVKNIKNMKAEGKSEQEIYNAYLELAWK